MNDAWAIIMKAIIIIHEVSFLHNNSLLINLKNVVEVPDAVRARQPKPYLEEPLELQPDGGGG